MGKTIKVFSIMKMTEESLAPQFYGTSDLALATTLSLFYPIESMDRTDVHRVFFTFKRTVELENTIEAYWKGELRIEPQTFFGKLKTIKARLYEER